MGNRCDRHRWATTVQSGTFSGGTVDTIAELDATAEMAIDVPGTTLAAVSSHERDLDRFLEPEARTLLRVLPHGLDGLGASLTLIGAIVL